MEDRDALVFDFIREAARQGPATVTDREIAEFLAETEGGNNEQRLPQARDVIRRLTQSGQVARQAGPDGTISAVYPRPISAHTSER